MSRAASPSLHSRFSRLRFTVVLALCTLVVLSAIATWWAERQLSGPVVEWARVRATNMATAAINGAIRDSLAEKLDEIDTFRVSEREGGGPAAIRYNIGPLNQVMSDATQSILETFRNQSAQEFRVPFGELTGMRVLAGWGPMVPIRIFATGSVVAEPRVEFVSAGINQVAHRLYLDVTVTMVVLAPMLSDEIVVRQPVPITDDILPGDVPGTYVNLTGFSGSLQEAAMILQSMQGGAAP